MPYQELHFNSDILTTDIAYGGTRNKRLLELNDPFYLGFFHIKNVQLPIFFKTINETTTQAVRVVYGGNITDFTFDIITGFYDDDMFAEHVKTRLRAAIKAAIATIDEATLVVSYDNQDGNQMTILWPENDGAANNYVSSRITWSSYIAKIFSRDEFYTEGETQTDRLWVSRFPVKLIPNYVYLHSNLMTATASTSVHRALGSFKSRTIMCKIPFDSIGAWSSMFNYTNHELSMELMYNGGGSEFNRIEFWFTDESGDELDFGNVPFSLTLVTI